MVFNCGVGVRTFFVAGSFVEGLFLFASHWLGIFSCFASLYLCVPIMDPI